MKRSIIKSKHIQILIVIVGLLVSGIVVVQGSEQRNQEAITQSSSLEHLKKSIQENKGLIVNSYLLGLSIFRETTE